MKWFKHDTDAKEDVKIKLLEKKHGLIGYAVYFKTLEIIGKSIDKDNVDEWGFVETVHSIDTLAESVGIESGHYRDIIGTCDELGLFSKLNDKLYCEKILFRLDEYADRLLNKKQLKKLINQRKKLSGQTPDTIGTLSGHYRARIEQNRTEQNREKPKANGFRKNNKKEYVKEFSEWLEAFNEKYNTKYKSQALLPNYSYWRNDYSKDELLQIIPKIRKHDWLKDKIKPELVLRQKDTHGNPVNRIGELLSIPEEQYL